MSITNNRLTNAALKGVQCLALVGALTLWSPWASAFEVADCGFTDSVGFLVSPLTYFYNGRVRVAHIDTDGEPVCCSSYVLIFIDDEDMPGSSCYAVGLRSSAGEISLGFAEVAFSRMMASYDPSTGLDLRIPYALYEDHLEGRNQDRIGRVRIDFRQTPKVRVVE